MYLFVCEFMQSVGRSLTFEQSVREAIELQKNYRCKNPVCETQVWKLRHELDMAQLNISRLKRLLRYSLRSFWLQSRTYRVVQKAVPRFLLCDKCV